MIIIIDNLKVKTLIYLNESTQLKDGYSINYSIDDVIRWFILLPTWFIFLWHMAPSCGQTPETQAGKNI